MKPVGDTLSAARDIGIAPVDASHLAMVPVEARPVRRRGMKPLVEATVSDGTGIMKATFFNQPGLSAQYPAGTRLMLSFSSGSFVSPV